MSNEFDGISEDVCISEELCGERTIIENDLDGTSVEVEYKCMYTDKAAGIAATVFTAALAASYAMWVIDKISGEQNLDKSLTDKWI